jgi:hypothetical protein
LLRARSSWLRAALLHRRTNGKVSSNEMTCCHEIAGDVIRKNLAVVRQGRWQYPCAYRQ